MWKMDLMLRVDIVYSSDGLQITPPRSTQIIGSQMKCICVFAIKFPYIRIDAFCHIPIWNVNRKIISAHLINPNADNDGELWNVNGFGILSILLLFLFRLQWNGAAARYRDIFSSK